MTIILLKFCQHFVNILSTFVNIDLTAELYYYIWGYWVDINCKDSIVHVQENDTNVIIPISTFQVNGTYEYSSSP